VSTVVVVVLFSSFQLPVAAAVSVSVSVSGSTEGNSAEFPILVFGGKVVATQLKISFRLAREIRSALQQLRMWTKTF